MAASCRKRVGLRMAGLAVAFAAAVLAGERPASAQGRAVIELFTSQGCSSCPPADALMRTLREEPGIIALTLPVDYWDYLGWRDTLASPANSQRQRAYAAARGDRAVYTPQMVVNGVAHAVGSRPSEIQRAIRDSRRSIGSPVPISIAADRTSVTVTLGDAPAGVAGKGTVWLVLYDDAEHVTIKRGENAGRKVTYYNVVKEMTPVGMWHGKAETFELPRPELKARGAKKCAVLVQVGNAGPIIGAAELTGL